jgi:ribosomal protein S12 methylthiotransferase accessory factor
VQSLSARLLDEACGFRHGIVPPLADVEPTFAELDGVFNACIVGDTGSTRDSTAGGFARTRESAHAACVAEALERYAASIARAPLRSAAELTGRRLLRPAEFALFSGEQRARPGFAWPAIDEPAVRYVEVFSLADNAPAWAPQELVMLGSRVDPAIAPSTSTGLAAHPDPLRALESAVEELLERDALTVTWLGSLGGRELALPAAYTDPVIERGGEVRAFDLTQAWNPHPVVAVCGFLPLRGQQRFALGAACRGDHARALDKAWLEFLQGTVFAGYYCNEHPELVFRSPSEVRDFPQHGAYYTRVPGDWAKLPLLGRARPFGALPSSAPAIAPSEALDRLQRALATAGIRVFYRNLTLPDVADAGLTVVRALSPELSLLHGDEQAPFLGGRTRDTRWRYPDLEPGPFPNPLPHPLG